MTEDRRMKMVDIIRKLMLKAMDNSTTKAESNTFKEKAADLMAKYQISMSETTIKEDVVEDGVDSNTVDAVTEGRMRWAFYLAQFIAGIFECKALRHTGTHTLRFFGFPDDLKTTTYFFNYLQIEISQRTRRQNWSTKKEEDSYAFGMSQRVYLRMMEVYERVQEIIPSECRDLIVLKDKAVDSKIKSTFGKVRNSKTTAKDDPTAYRAGYKDGANIDIGDHSKRKVNN